MNRKQFRALMSEVGSIVEQAARDEAMLQESVEAASQNIASRVRALKQLSRNLYNEEAYSDEYETVKQTDGVAAMSAKAPKASGEDSSKPRDIKTASLSNGSKKLPQGLASQVKGSPMDALDMGKRSGKMTPEEPEAEEADYDLVSEPETYGEAIEKLRKDWKRLMGESSWSAGKAVPPPISAAAKKSGPPPIPAAAKKSGPPPIPAAAKKPLSPLSRAAIDQLATTKYKEGPSKFKGLVPGVNEAGEEAIGGGSLGVSSLAQSKPKPKISIKGSQEPRELGSSEFKQLPPPIPKKALGGPKTDVAGNKEIINRMMQKHMDLSAQDLGSESDSPSSIIGRLGAKYGAFKGQKKPSGPKDPISFLDDLD